MSFKNFYSTHYHPVYQDYNVNPLNKVKWEEKTYSTVLCKLLNSWSFPSKNTHYCFAFIIFEVIYTYISGAGIYIYISSLALTLNNHF